MVRPVDLQDNLSKAPLAGRLQQLQQDAPEMALRQANRVVADQQRADQTRPVPSGQTEGLALRPDGRKQQLRGRRGKRPRRVLDAPAPGNSGDRGAAQPEGDTSHIDIIA